MLSPPPSSQPSNDHQYSALLHILAFFLALLAFFCLVLLYEWQKLTIENQPQPQDIEQGVSRNQQEAGPINGAGGHIIAPTEVSGTVVIYREHEKIANCSECAICLEDFSEGEQCRLLDRCKHMYHKACIDKWLIRDKHCPLCRGSVRGHAHSNNQNQS